MAIRANLHACSLAIFLVSPTAQLTSLSLIDTATENLIRTSSPFSSSTPKFDDSEEASSKLASEIGNVIQTQPFDFKIDRKFV